MTCTPYHDIGDDEDGEDDDDDDDDDGEDDDGDDDDGDDGDDDDDDVLLARVGALGGHSEKLAPTGGCKGKGSAAALFRRVD